MTITTLTTKDLAFTIGDTSFDGVLVSDGTTRRPAVLVFHGWEGRSDAQVKIAKALARKGYAAFACNVFGRGIRGEITGDNSALIAPLLQDRALLRERLLGNVRFVQSLAEVDPQRMVAIGFCFGGLCVLDIARTGVELRGVASFHGMLGRPQDAPVVPIRAKVIVFHGWEDPLAPPNDVVALGRELTEAKADWQLLAFGDTMHAFMAPGVDRPEAGLRYNERSARRAWAALDAFLQESFAS